MQNLSDAGSWLKLPNYQKGRLGEALAVRWLIDRGFSIVSRNFRIGRYEVDIVAEKNNRLFAIEVKIRFTIQYGSVEEYLSEQKIQQMTLVGSALLDRYPQCVSVELILLSIVVCSKEILFSWVEI